MKPSVLIAAGCSWVVGKNVDPEYTFARQLQQHLGLSEFYSVARNGANNTEQINKLVDYVNSNHNQYSRIFVLWGITSIYRWEMYTALTDSVEACAVGRGQDELKKEVKYYFSHYFNEDYELKKLNTQVVMLDGYLKSLSIDHLFVNSFQSYQIDSADNKYFYQVTEKDNDMLSLLCRVNNVKISTSSVPFLNLTTPGTQFNNHSVQELQRTGWLDQDSAHPTVQAHELIANKLHSYIKEKAQ
jgi:hypothetical protein